MAIRLEALRQDARRRMAVKERDPSTGRHQFRDADASTRVGTGTDDVINGCAECRAAVRSEARTRGAATRRVAPP